MSYVQKNMKFLKGRQKNLQFFETYLDISKLRILQLLNEEQKALEAIKMIKYTNSKFLEAINANFFKNEKTFIEQVDSNRKSKEEIYFLVDAKENDEYAEVMYKKLEETLEAKIKKGDSIVTVGNRVNMIAQKLELKVIQHFPYELYENNQSDFINKVATIIEVGFKNGIFTDATLIVAQQNQDNRELVMKKLAPFEIYSKEDDIYSDSKAIQKTTTADFDDVKQNILNDYSKYFKDLNIKKISWLPNVSFFKFKLIKAIIKQNIVELSIVEKIQRLKLELTLLDEKKNKINDELTVVQRLVNRVRREKETESSIVLYSAFKVRNSGTSVLDEVRKKKEEDDALYRRPKGGAR